MRVVYSAFVNNNPTAILEKSFTSFGMFFKFKNELFDVLGLDIRCIRIIVTLYNHDNRILCNRFVGNYLVGAGQFEFIHPELAKLIATHPEIEC